MILRTSAQECKKLEQRDETHTRARADTHNTDAASVCVLCALWIVFVVLGDGRNFVASAMPHIQTKLASAKVV